MSAPRPSSSSFSGTTDSWEEEREERFEHRPSEPPSAEAGRWWFSFDRWLAVVTNPDDDFVLA